MFHKLIQTSTISLLFLLLFSCTLIKNSKHSQQLPQTTFNNTSIDSTLAQTHQLINQSQLDSAKTILDSLLTRFPKSASAHFQMGLLYSKKDSLWGLAESFFKQAIRLNKKYPEAYYFLGLLYLNGPFLKEDAIRMFKNAIRYRKDYKAALYQRALAIIKYRGYVAGLKRLEKLVILDPYYKDCYFIYKRLGFAFHQFKRLRKLLPKLIFQYPQNPELKLDLVNSLYRSGKHQQTLAFLDSLKNKFPNYDISLQHLNEARTRFALEQDSLATILYWQAVNNIFRVEQAHEIFKDIIYIATNLEYDNYLNGTLENKKDFFRVFWKSRDPTLTTDFNERLPEHYGRLRYAQKHNQRYPVLEFLEYFLEDFSEPLERFSAPLMVHLGSTKGVKQQQEIDDQGVIYIRHGDPDGFYIVIRGAGKTNVSWRYNAKFGRPKLIFNFFIPEFDSSHAGMKDGWRLRLTPAYSEDMWELDARYILKYSAGQLISETMRAIALATATETCNFKPAGKSLEFSYCYLSFKGKDEFENFYFYYELPKDVFPDSDEKHLFHLKHEIATFNYSWEKVSDFSEIETYSKLSSVHCSESIRKFPQNLIAGKYYVGLKLKDLRNNSEGHLRTRIKVPSSWSPNLQISNILIGKAIENDPWLINQQLSESAAATLIPNIHKKFFRDEPILIYFEIYNLSLEKSKKTSFNITLHVKQIEKYGSGLVTFVNKIIKIFNKSKAAQMSVSDYFSGNKSDEFISRGILLSEYSSGRYLLTVNILDIFAQTKVTDEIEFEIVENK